MAVLPSRRPQTSLGNPGTGDGALGAPNQRWSVDFVSDQFLDSRRLRIFAVVDDCTRECLALIANTSSRCARGRHWHRKISFFDASQKCCGVDRHGEWSSLIWSRAVRSPVGIITDDAGNDHGAPDIPDLANSAHECQILGWTIRIGGDTSRGSMTIMAARAGKRRRLSTHCARRRGHHGSSHFGGVKKKGQPLYLQVQFYPIKTRRGPKRAIIAVASIFTTIYHMLKNGTM
jgi:hypothetical protein